MMKNNRIFAAFAAFCLTILPMANQAQNPQLTLDDLIPGGKTYHRFAPRTIRQLQWCGNKYMFVRGDSLLLATPGKKTDEQPVCTPHDLSAALTAAGLPTVKSLPAVSAPYPDKPILSLQVKGHRVLYNYQDQKVILSLDTDPQGTNFDFSPQSKCLAFTKDNNLGIVTPENKTLFITNDTDKVIVNGQSVHRNEFGISKGTFWSPGGSKIAFYRMDQSMVTDYPLVNVNTRCAMAQPIKYPMAGMKSHEVTVGVYQIATGNTVFLQTGLPKEKYLTNIAWSPDEKNIYIAEVNREQNECNLVRYNVQTGQREGILFTETHPKYVEPQSPVLFVKNKPDLFIWQSQRDGYNHLYLYQTDGTLVSQLTSGPWVVTDVLGFDDKGDNLFFISTEVSPLDRHLYKVNLKTKKRTRLTTEEGVHAVQLSADRNYFIDNYSSQYNPRKINISSTKKEKNYNLLSVSDPYKGYAMPEIKVGTIKAADGVTDLYYRLVTPPTMDSDKKYPTVVYVYGGPHAQMIRNTWLADTRGWDIYMAQRGYVICTVDSRGSANRGLAFENVIHRQIGVNEMADQLKGIEFLKSLPYVDPDRIGVHGWSYGGFMTTNLMLTYPEIFKVGVAGGPVIDWNYYEIMYGERYMDRPQENPEGYKNSNLKNKASHLKGRLLLIHGDIDPVVVWQHTLSFLEACVNVRTYPDYFVYPRHEHNVIGKDRVHLYENITRYFDDHLKNKKQTVQ